MAEVSGSGASSVGRKTATAVAGIGAGVLSFYSFILTPTIFAKIPNPGRGEMLAAIFPVYFLVALTLSAALFGAVLWWRPAGGWKLLSSGLALALAALNEFYTGPLLAGLGEQIRAQNITDPASPLKHDFGKWHGVSQGANLIIILAFWFVLVAALRDPKPAAE